MSARWDEAAPVVLEPGLHYRKVEMCCSSWYFQPRMCRLWKNHFCITSCLLQTRVPTSLLKKYSLVLDSLISPKCLWYLKAVEEQVLWHWCLFLWPLGTCLDSYLPLEEILALGHPHLMIDLSKDDGMELSPLSKCYTTQSGSPPLYSCCEEPFWNIPPLLLLLGENGAPVLKCSLRREWTQARTDQAIPVPATRASPLPFLVLRTGSWQPLSPFNTLFPCVLGIFSLFCWDWLEWIQGMKAMFQESVLKLLRQSFYFCFPIFSSIMIFLWIIVAHDLLVCGGRT